MTIEQDEIEISKIKNISEAQTFLDKKRKVFVEEGAAIPILLDEDRTSEELQKFQGDLHSDERIMLLFRGVLNRFDKDKKLSDINHGCDKIISELRVFEERVDKKRREKVASEEKKEFNLLSFFSLGILFPSAAKNLMEFFFPGNTKAAKIVTIVVATFGINYHFRKDISKLWRKVAGKISEKDTALGICVYGLGNTLAYKARGTRDTFIDGVISKTKRLSATAGKVRSRVGRKTDNKNDLV